MGKALRSASIRLSCALAVLGTLMASGAAHAAVKLPKAFSDHMVLQREMPVPIWGAAAPGERVTVKFRGQEKTATAGSDGKWMLKLDPLAAGGPDKMTVSGTNSITVDDVLVGEVWLGSGQSNMALHVRAFAKDDPILAAAAAEPHPKLRILQGFWREAIPSNVENLSALGFYFGLCLQKELDVPVGVILAASGGTPSAFWLSEKAFAEDAACQEAVKKYSSVYDEAKERKKYQEDLEKWEKAASSAKEQGKPEPRKPFPPAKPGEASRGKIGCLFESMIRPVIPYAIRGALWDQGGAGTDLAGVDQYALMGALIRGWRKEWGQGEFPFVYMQKPSGGGCAWNPDDPVTNKADAFSPLPSKVPEDDGDVIGIRLKVGIHLKIAEYPNVAMIPTGDLGGGWHPVNKSGYGRRAADVVMVAVYGRKGEACGPRYESHSIEGRNVRVKFKNVGEGLAFRHGDKLQGFAVAGEDGVFHWADARIDGISVVVSSDKVDKPVAVRYAWAAKRPWANLFSKGGLPAIPFSSDFPVGVSSASPVKGR